MTRETCAKFAEAITSTIHSASDHRVRALFDRHSRTLGNGYLLLEHELQAFYQEQAGAGAKEEAVRANLAAQRIGPDLKPMVDWLKLSMDEDPRVVRDETILPRSKLSRSHNLFETVLSLVEHARGDEADALWSLLMSLPTNERIENQILENQDFDSLLGLGKDTGASSSGNLYRVLYAL